MPDPQISRNLPNRINLSHARRLYGTPVISGNPQLDDRGELQSGAAYLQTEPAGMVANVAGQFTPLPDIGPLVENRDPWKVRIPRMGRTAWEIFRKTWAGRRLLMTQLRDGTLPIRVRFDILQAGRPLNDQEMIEVREEVETRQLQEFHNIQAMRCRNRLINKLTLLGYCDAKQVDGRRQIRREVEIGYMEVSPLAYILYVTFIPWGVKSMDIANDAVCTDLSLSVGHPVRSEIKQMGNTVIGLRYTVEIAATLGIPNLCKFSELLPQISPTAAPLTFLVGYSEGKHVRWADLEKLPHLLGGGETMGGKSNMMHVMICSLVSRNAPSAVRMVMMDLKFKGIELKRYEGLPHLIPIPAGEMITHGGAKSGTNTMITPEVKNGIAVTEDQAVSVLRWALAEAEQRGEMFTRAGARDLRQWNSRRPKKRLPYIVIVCDELGQLRLNPSKAYTDLTYSLLQKLLAQGRAAGVSFVAFTQAGNRQVLDELSKINLPGRICFSTPDAGSSVRFVGDGSAHGLTPAGRGVFKHGTTKYIVQTPLIYSSDIAEVIANAREGKLTTRLTAHPVSPVEVIEWALEFNQSNLAVRDAVAHFTGELDRIAKNALEALLKEMDGQTYQVSDGSRYKVLPSIGGRPRVLERQTADGETAPADPDQQDRTQDAEVSADGWKAIGGRRCGHCRIEVVDVEATACPQCGAPL